MKSQSAISDIQTVIQLYLDGIHDGNVEHLQRAMHPDCRMVCPSHDDYVNIGMSEYFDLVASRESPRHVGESRADEVLTITQVNGEVALVHLRCLVLGKLSEDALILLRHEGSWRIISKVFSYELVSF